jgi:endonuclease G
MRHRPQFVAIALLALFLALASIVRAAPPAPPRALPSVAAVHTAAAPARAALPAQPAKAPHPQTLSIVIRKQVVQVAPPAPEAVALTASPQLVLGVPKSNSVTVSSEVMLNKGSYVVAYDPLRNEPSWVSWHLDRRSVLVSMAHTRANNFRGDKDLPKDMYHVVPNDYLHSGYDMGHLVPSDDRSRAPKQNADTFLMTNMTPHRPEMNRGPWKHLENYERKLATDQGKEVEVMAGPIFSQRPKTIGKGVAVPSAFFKIAVIHDAGQEVTAKSDVIAVIMPNSTAVADTKWTKFIVSPKDIEEATGREFFTNLPPEVGAALRDKKADIRIESLGAPPR